MTMANEKGEDLDLGLWYPLEQDRACEEVGNQKSVGPHVVIGREATGNGSSWNFIKTLPQGWCSACVRCVSQVH